MTRTLIIAAALIAGMATAAQAQMVCDTRDSIVEMLGKVYGEVRRGGGLGGGNLLEIWVSEATGTFSILQTYPSGFTCIVAAGDGWHDYTAELIPTGDPA